MPGFQASAHAAQYIIAIGTWLPIIAITAQDTGPAGLATSMLETPHQRVKPIGHAGLRPA
jgi:hypothetical protein